LRVDSTALIGYSPLTVCAVLLPLRSGRDPRPTILDRLNAGDVRGAGNATPQSRYRQTRAGGAPSRRAMGAATIGRVVKRHGHRVFAGHKLPDAGTTWTSITGPIGRHRPGAPGVRGHLGCLLANHSRAERKQEVESSDRIAGPFCALGWVVSSLMR
jgi:hypothetical protein